MFLVKHPFDTFGEQCTEGCFRVITLQYFNPKKQPWKPCRVTKTCFSIAELISGMLAVFYVIFGALIILVIDRSPKMLA